jgi:hypothetical protein
VCNVNTNRIMTHVIFTKKKYIKHIKLEKKKNLREKPSLGKYFFF